MIALMDLANYTVAMSFVADELLQRPASKRLAGDNLAALALYGGTAAHWRARHLRIRATGKANSQPGMCGGVEPGRLRYEKPASTGSCATWLD